MGNFDNYGGLTSQTGSVGGGSGTYAGDRGILFPEFDQWARVNDAILKTTTRARMTDDGIEETITIDIDFNDNLWRPASTILANQYIPKKGDSHPTISGCILDDVSLTHYNNQPDHFRGTFSYKFPRAEAGGGSSSGGSGANGALTPLDTPFLINFTPVITRIPLDNDLSPLKQPIINPNGEPYDIKINKVRLDGVCKWNQFDWDQTDSEKLTNIINKDTWTVGDYKFSKETVLLNYVVGNLKFYTDEEGRRVKYYEMEAGISVDNNGWGVSNGGIEITQQGSFYYNQGDKKLVKQPRDRSGNINYHLNDDGTLASGNVNQPTVENPSTQFFKIYNTSVFNFVDI